MELEAFLEDVAKHPHDDHPRLVLADYLEERGDERAELIRIQFAIADLKPHDQAYRKLRKRELQLLREHGSFVPAPRFCKVLGYRGGFVDSIDITITRFLKWQSQLFARLPLRSVALTGRSARFRSLAASRHLPELESVRFHNNHASDAELADVIGGVHWRRLRSLDITSDLGDEVIESIAGNASCQTLRSLSLNGYQMSGRAVRILEGAAHLKGLEELLATYVSDDDAERIAKAAWRLKSLSISGPVNSSGLLALHRGASCQGLRRLEVMTRGGRGAFREFLGERIDQPLPELRVLRLGYTGGSALLQWIAETYRDLEELELAQCNIDDVGAQALAASPLLSSLRRLVLTNNELTSKGIEALGRSPNRRPGTKFFLRNNRVTNLDIKDLKGQFGKTFGGFGETLDRWHRW